MRRSRKRWIIFAVFVATLFAIALTFVTRVTTPTSEAVGIAFTGYTNPPGSDRKFAFFTITNRAEYDVRWRGDGVEIEGRQGLEGRIVSTLLPGQTYTPVLKSGDTLTLTVGEPFYAHETGRWRIVMLFSRYTPRERWLDLSFKGKVPNRIGRFVIVDSQEVFSVTNRTQATSEWLEKSEPVEVRE